MKQKSLDFLRSAFVIKRELWTDTNWRAWVSKLRLNTGHKLAWMSEQVAAKHYSQVYILYVVMTLFWKTLALFSLRLLGIQYIWFMCKQKPDSDYFCFLAHSVRERVYWCKTTIPMRTRIPCQSGTQFIPTCLCPPMPRRCLKGEIATFFLSYCRLKNEIL